jgi:xyloglucan galactosyltransferase MUR3
MFSSLWNRLKRSRRRTRDPSQASLFIVPYDVTVDTSYKQNCKRLNPEMKFPLTETLLKVQLMLRESTYFQRHNGTDHLVLNSFRSFGNDVKKMKKKRKTADASSNNFLLDLCKDCLKTCFYRYRHHSDRFIPVPYASSFHYHDAMGVVPWIMPKKTILITYVGGWKTDVASSANLRHIIVNNCQHSKNCVAKRLVHQDNVLKKYKYHEYRYSTFCLQPPGDDPSRKGVMDSILCGCIPVTFHPDTLLAALPLHLSEAEAREISVYIPEHVAQNTSTFNIVSFLESIPQTEIAKKQLKISSIAFRLQYSAPPLAYLRNRSDETPWDPPFPDGVDRMLDGMIALARQARSSGAAANSSRPLLSHPYDIASNIDLQNEYSSVIY